MRCGRQHKLLCTYLWRPTSLITKASLAHAVLRTLPTLSSTTACCKDMHSSFSLKGSTSRKRLEGWSTSPACRGEHTASRVRDRQPAPQAPNAWHCTIVVMAIGRKRPRLHRKVSRCRRRPPLFGLAAYRWDTTPDSHRTVCMPEPHATRKGVGHPVTCTSTLYVLGGSKEAMAGRHVCRVAMQVSTGVK